MTEHLGLTWDHPRGRNALQAAADRFGDGERLHWQTQPLEGFESAPIDQLARRYDLLVLDHPHLGDAIATDSLRPLDELYDAEQVQRWAQQAAGPTIASYQLGGKLWALPLDAATQVSVRRRDLVPRAPATWDEVAALAEHGRVALSLAGPHAFLTLCSVAVAFGDRPGSTPGVLFERSTAERALALLAHLAARAPEGTDQLNPIGLLERMRHRGDLGYLPLVYGYVNYSSPQVVFADAPAQEGRIGSTLGGTGIAVTRRARPTPALLAHLRWLLEARTQRTFIPTHDGQPGLRAAWTDPEVDTAAHGFYSGTWATLEAAWVRPRLPGYVPFQTEASALVRTVLTGERPAGGALDELEERFAQLAHPAAERT